MEIQTLFWVVLCAVLALALVWFQYFYKNQRRELKWVFLSFLRFLSVFCLLLLLVNPEFTSTTYNIQKPELVILADNSASIKAVSGVKDLSKVLTSLSEDEDLKKQFKILQYSFGNSLKISDTINNTALESNIAKALNGVAKIHSKTPVATILLSDGNQTIGEDYAHFITPNQMGLYSITLGDTTQYKDFSIGNINLNKYAFLNNKYPVEIYVHYKGKGNSSSNFTVTSNGKKLYSKLLDFTEDNNSQFVSFHLKADKIGVTNLNFSLSPLNNEKNILNNSRKQALEVIDEKTKVVFFTTMNHPDIGALKKAIEVNGQRSVSIFNLRTNKDKTLPEADVYILYQPNIAFEEVYKVLKNKDANIFTITGPKTDWRFLNKIQNVIQKNVSGADEAVFPIKNAGFSLFNLENFNPSKFPPLQEDLGEILINRTHEVLLEQEIKGALLGEPMLVVADNDGAREAILFGEGIWKWRLQEYRDQNNFKNFDQFIGQIVRYITANKSKSRLDVTYNTIYNGTQEAILTAKYFDTTFEFDPNAAVKLFLKSEHGNKEIPMPLKGSFYKADLSNLLEGAYSFRIEAGKDFLEKKGQFTIVSFDRELQNKSANDAKMIQLVLKNKGAHFYPSKINSLKKELLNNPHFTPVQIPHEKKVSLIDFKWLLGAVLLLLGLEWLIRKYNGLL